MVGSMAVGTLGLLAEEQLTPTCEEPQEKGTWGAEQGKRKEWRAVHIISRSQ